MKKKEFEQLLNYYKNNSKFKTYFCSRKLFKKTLKILRDIEKRGTTQKEKAEELIKYYQKRIDNCADCNDQKMLSLTILALREEIGYSKHDIRMITQKEAIYILNNKERNYALWGIYIVQPDKNGIYTTIDNRDGNAYKDEFKSLISAQQYLLGGEAFYIF